MKRADWKHFAPGVLLDDRFPGCDCYYGDADSLIAAGLVEENQLPGRPGRGKTSATYADGVPVVRGSSPVKDERYFSIKLCGKGFYEVHKYVALAERKRREDAWHAASEREAARRAEMEDIKQRQFLCDGLVERLPACDEDFRERAVKFLCEVPEIARGGFGFRFAAEVIDEIDHHVNALYELIGSGQVIFDRREQVNYVRGLYERYGLTPTLDQFKAPVLHLVRR